jgi:hypothetical protein
MLLKNSWRFIVLTALAVAVSLLLLRYKSLQAEKATLLVLAFYLPFDGNAGHDWSRETFCYKTETGNPDGFFTQTEVYENLGDAAGNLTTANGYLRGFIPGYSDSVTWDKKSVSAILHSHESKATIPQPERDYFQYAMVQYIRAFEEVLKQDRWKAWIDRPELQYEDSIKLDVSSVARELKVFSEHFSQRGQIVIDTLQVDLANSTAFELFVALEYIKWHRNDIESDYNTIFRSRHKQWIDTVQHKWKY